MVPLQASNETYVHLKLAHGVKLAVIMLGRTARARAGCTLRPALHAHEPRTRSSGHASSRSCYKRVTRPLSRQHDAAVARAGWGNFGNMFKGDPAKKTRERLQPIVDQVNSLEANMQAKSDEELRQVAAALRERAKANESLDQLLPEAFAVRLTATHWLSSVFSVSQVLITGWALWCRCKRASVSTGCLIEHVSAEGHRTHAAAAERTEFHTWRHKLMQMPAVASCTALVAKSMPLFRVISLSSFGCT